MLVTSKMSIALAMMVISLFNPSHYQQPYDISKPKRSYQPLKDKWVEMLPQPLPRF